jgi:uncharacterized membrane protein YgcG
MKTLEDEMASVGHKLDDEELVSFILTGLDADYDPIVSAVTARVEPITVAKLYSQLMSHKQRMEICGSTGNQSSVNMASRGGRYQGGNRGGGRSSGNRGGYNCGKGGHGGERRRVPF